MTAQIGPQKKQEHQAQAEGTTPGKYYTPYTDIYETPEALTLVMDMPGVGRDRVEVMLDQNRLRVDGTIEHAQYDGLRPLYTEYNVGHFTRSFTLSRRIDRDRITAEMQDGVLTLRLPVAEEAKPRKIEVG